MPAQWSTPRSHGTAGEKKCAVFPAGLMSPTLGKLPYVYDKLTTWPGCEDRRITRHRL